MLSPYRALLKDNQLEWLDDQPLLTGKATTVYVTLIEEPKTTSPNQAIEILEKIAELNGGIKQITDPMEWQREIRQDRPLPFQNHYESSRRMR